MLCLDLDWKKMWAYYCYILRTLNRWCVYIVTGWSIIFKFVDMSSIPTLVDVLYNFLYSLPPDKGVFISEVLGIPLLHHGSISSTTTGGVAAVFLWAVWCVPHEGCSPDNPSLVLSVYSTTSREHYCTLLSWTTQFLITRGISKTSHIRHERHRAR